MEIWFVIAPILAVWIVGCLIISIQEWITDMQFYRRKTQKELNRIRRSLGKVECAETTVSTGKVYVFGGPKVGTVTGTVGYEQLEEMGATLNEADKLIKDAREWKVCGRE